MSGPVADRIGAVLASGQLSIRAGRIHGYERTPDGQVAVAFRPRSGDGLDCVTISRVVNCAGPDADCSRRRIRGS